MCCSSNVRRYEESVQFEQIVVVRSFWWVEADPSSVIILVKMDRSWVQFCTRVTKVQVSTNLPHNKAVIANLVMNEVNRDSDVFDPCCDSLGIKDIDAWLTILVDWRRQY